ncbi:RdgB/HAM1 family non-canonical purine NTP pyrophosphatase [Paenibacillus agilis]|uniref:dITP/XTP pyrophosphatase n=1 Tax=Paenibacillus agilis TaxID=3020863 RepID=A0A559IHS2_9BACL|nr:RdgB/HAM1 family non-canonical purine NTP pyrophosphatase [Paenibacillus agilis]TVX87216.1 RdgB/HAM1 family non-canonical purine NTP pyrophosphatase [Paenibacillus agilis]
MPVVGDTILVATRNAGKVREFTLAFSALGLQVKSLADYPLIPDVEEDGETFLENAFKKAMTVAEALRIPVLADDSGLAVERLNGEPGVYSARYAGEHGNDEANNALLINNLRSLKADREQYVLADGEEAVGLSSAQFVCALVLYDPNTKQSYEAVGTCDGVIVEQARGNYGFGYDPHFYVPSYERTMAELTPEEKQRISHRGEALRLLLQRLSLGVGH